MPRLSRKRNAGRIEAPASLLYKVVELSTVDEGSLEQTVNDFVQQGWTLDGVQFAMRESSKRPSMAFVFFTRNDSNRSARKRDIVAVTPRPMVDAYRRLEALAQEGDEP